MQATSFKLQRERKDFGVPPNLCYKNSTNLNGLRISTYCGGGNRNPLSSLSRMTYLNGEGQNPTPHGTEDSSNLKEMDVNHHSMRTVGNSTNIVWQECSVGKAERQKLLQQKGCVIWITGLSGSGKSTLACSLSRQLHCRGKLTYILDGDNVRHGLNKDLSFKAEDRAENIRRIGEVAKLFADAGVICIASLISPYRRDRDACRAMLPEGTFIEVFMNMPLEVCEARDSKGLYKLARAGKIKGFTGIDDPYEPPVNCEIVVEQKDGVCSSPTAMAEQVVAYLEDNGFLQA
ncbi:adenylyl-sulfate kinase 3 isoform X2 [Amborella trichopoda]|uniref:adenylyl-sulfate kinase 3 isoform X2 n=1 Tax=Amborella trichopoda TaxID=13333 RepID=UPI0009C18BA7|nr:adenylyl-sulfate kinase 3 isoform X2 [Amborella trichopoda]|eukprot:XP_020520939.1 adenylyl-sulfate kinase 3 isoform X2 [Amborella trichopoda]